MSSIIFHHVQWNCASREPFEASTGNIFHVMFYEETISIILIGELSHWNQINLINVQMLTSDVVILVWNPVAVGFIFTMWFNHLLRFSLIVELTSLAEPNKTLIYFHSSCSTFLIYQRCGISRNIVAGYIFTRKCTTATNWHRVAAIVGEEYMWCLPSLVKSAVIL